MGNVCLLRLDATGGPAPGNKSFKLNGYLTKARQQGIKRLVSFGGAWSNHLHALAGAGWQCGLATVGIVRGDEDRVDSAMLADARRWGMHIVPVSRAEYRQRHDSDYQQDLIARFAPCLLIPEGGASALGAAGCREIADIIRSAATPARHVVVPVGTGTTLAGLVASLDQHYLVSGIAAVKGAVDLEPRVQHIAHDLGGQGCARWQILQDFHGGGFARVTPALRAFTMAFESVQGVALEPVYTAKMLFAVHQMLRRGEWNAAVPLLAIHTGGLQGRRGYPWLSGTDARPPVNCHTSV